MAKEDMSSSPVRPTNNPSPEHAPTPPTPPLTSPVLVPQEESIASQVAKVLLKLREGDGGFKVTTLPPAELLSPPVVVRQLRGSRDVEHDPWNPVQDRLLRASPGESPLSSVRASLTPSLTGKHYASPPVDGAAFAQPRNLVKPQTLEDIRDAPFRGGIWPTLAVMDDMNLKRGFIDADTARFSGGQIFELLRRQGRIAGKDGSSSTQGQHVVALAKKVARESTVPPGQVESKKRKAIVHLVPEAAQEPKRKAAKVAKERTKGDGSLVENVLWAVGEAYGQQTSQDLGGV